MLNFYIGKHGGVHYGCTVYDLHMVAGSIRLAIRCYQSDMSGNQITGEAMGEYFRMLTADNSTLVNPGTGDYVTPQQPDMTIPTGSIGEWDFFLHIAKSVPSIFFDLITATLIKNRNRLMPDGLIAEP